MKVASVTGIVLTKLDGTAKGGVVIPIANEPALPTKIFCEPTVAEIPKPVSDLKSVIF